MKKNYILMAGFISASLLAQGPANIPTSALSNDAQTASPKSFVELSQSKTSANSGQSLTRRGVNYAGFVKVGTSFYDLQTNSSMGRRIILNDDGTVAVTWTTSPTDAANFPQRGSGFNIKGTNGQWSPASGTRVESNDRTGWPNLAKLSNGNIITIGHFATSGGFYRTESPSPNTRPSGTSQNILVESPFKPIWGRMDNNGDTLHLICSYTDSAASGERRAPTRKGIFAPMVYSRSFDGGLTWNKAHEMLPNYDSSITNNGGADQYSICVKGRTVAIANSDHLQGVIIWKSTDAGTTFKRMLADSFAYAPYNSKKLMLDTPFTSDGSVEVLIDNSGSVHAFWGLGRVLNTDTTDESYSFFPGVQGIVHWKEGDPSGGNLIAAGGSFDRDGDGINALEAATTAALVSGAIPTTGNLSTVARLTNTSAMRSPSSGIDANGNIFVVFSVPIERDISDFVANYRDIAIVHSTDGGVTWAAPQNITQALGQEDDFASMAKTVDNFVHVVWQADGQCGNNLSNNDPNFGNHPVDNNDILYQAIPVADILAGNIGMQFGLSTKRPNTGNLSVVGNNYPNPFTGTTQVMVYLSQPGTINWTVRNMNGQVVKQGADKQLSRGNHMISMNCSNLPSGIYTYTLVAGGSSVSKKMIID